MTGGNAGWAKIFEALSIIDHVDRHGFYDITADEIKRISGREPRLMAKIDFREKLPAVMADAGLAMLAIKNGTYRIGRFDPFIDIDPECRVPVEHIPFPDGILSLHPRELAHESAVLDSALLSSILPRLFGEDVQLTIRGRVRSVPFSFVVDSVPIPVDGVQIEVDGGYEGSSTINLVEAKIGPRSNISLRQVMYPHLAWEKQAKGRKDVRSFLCLYQEPVLRFIPFVWTGAEKPRADHSRERAFSFEAAARLDLSAIAAQPPGHGPVPGAPFPQADNFDTVLAMFAIVAAQEIISKEDLFADFDIVERQIDYYSNVLRWLGLARIAQGMVSLTDEGRRIADLPHAQRMTELARTIFSEPIFRTALRSGTGAVPHNLFTRWKCGGTTIPRRLKTVESWIDYFRHFERNGG